MAKRKSRRTPIGPGRGVVKPEPSKPRRTPSFPAEKKPPTTKRIPVRVKQGYDVVDPKTGHTVRAETLSSSELKSYYKRTGITAPSNILQRFAKEEAEALAKKQAEESAKITTLKGVPSKPRAEILKGQELIRGKTKAILSMSPAARESFLLKATPEEKAELLVGTDITRFQIGEHGTALTKLKGEEEVVLEKTLREQRRLAAIEERRKEREGESYLTFEERKAQREPKKDIYDVVSEDQTFTELVTSKGLFPTAAEKVSELFQESGDIVAERFLGSKELSIQAPTKLFGVGGLIGFGVPGIQLVPEKAEDVLGGGLELGRTTVGEVVDVSSFLVPVLGEVRMGIEAGAIAEKAFVRKEPLTFGEKIFGVAAVGLGALRVGRPILQKLLKMKPGSVVAAVEPKTIAIEEEGGKIIYSTIADVTLVQKGLVRNKIVRGTIKVEGIGAPFAGDIKAVDINTKGFNEIMRLLKKPGTQSISKGKFESVFGKSKKIGKITGFATQEGDVIESITQVKALGKKAEVVVGKEKIILRRKFPEEVVMGLERGEIVTVRTDPAELIETIGLGIKPKVFPKLREAPSTIEKILQSRATQQAKKISDVLIKELSVRPIKKGEVSKFFGVEEISEVLGLRGIKFKTDFLTGKVTRVKDIVTGETEIIKKIMSDTLLGTRARVAVIKPPKKIPEPKVFFEGTTLDFKGGLEAIGEITKAEELAMKKGLKPPKVIKKPKIIDVTDVQALKLREEFYKALGIPSTKSIEKIAKVTAPPTRTTRIVTKAAEKIVGVKKIRITPIVREQQEQVTKTIESLGQETKEKQKERQVQIQPSVLSLLTGTEQDVRDVLGQITRQPIVTKQVQQQQQRFAQITRQISGETPPPGKIEEPPPPPPFILPKTKKDILLAKKRKLKEKKLKAQRRAYQASVGSVMLDISATPEQIKKLKVTGLELRPLVRRETRKQEIKRLQRQQKLLLSPAKGGRKKARKRIKAKQVSLVAPARRTRKQQRAMMKKINKLL